MFKTIFSKLKKKSALDKGTELELTRSFSDEVAFRNYSSFIKFYTDYFEANRANSDLPSHIKAQNLFSAYKKSGHLDNLNRFVEVGTQCK